MNELKEIKLNYLNLVKGNELLDVPILDIANKYIVEVDSYKKDIYAAVLILYCWPALERLYYKQNKKVLSLTDCYDIFMDSFLYVMEKHVWTDENNSLYNDEDAILKAMYVLVDSRRKNYFISQNRQKRVVNQYPVSLDSLSEEFQEGYFSPMVEKYNFDRGWEKEFVVSLWEQKKYIAAVIFDIIITLNVVTNEEVDFKKIKKYLKNLPEKYYNAFIHKYNLVDKDLVIYNKYIKAVDENRIYTYITNTMAEFKESIKLQEIKDNNVN